MKIRWTDNAAADLKSAHEYLSGNSPASADVIIDRILATIDRLESFPQMGRQGRIVETREFTVPDTRFIVLYRIRHNAIEILGVLHGARKWPNHL